MSAQIRVFISGKVCYLHIEDDLSECLLLCNGVFLGIKQCGYLYRKHEMVDVDPATFLRENKILIDQLCDSRRIIPCSLNRTGRVLKIHLNERDSSDGDLVLVFRSYSRSTVMEKSVAARLSHELSLNDRSREVFSGEWGGHSIPREYLELHQKKRELDIERHNLDAFKRALDSWLPSEVEKMRIWREKLTEALLEASSKEHERMREEYQRKFEEEENQYRSDIMNYFSPKKRKIAKNLDEQYKYDLQFLDDDDEVSSHMHGLTLSRKHHHDPHHERFSFIDSPKHYHFDD